MPLFLIFFGGIFSGNSQEIEKYIGGVVTTDGRPLSNVNITIKGSTKGVKTDIEGRFEIAVKPKDILVFSFVGMHSTEVPISEETGFLRVKLVPKVEVLDEVTVKKRKRKTQQELLAEYPTNKNLLKTSWGILDKDRSSFSMRMVDGADLIPVGNDFLHSLQNFIPQMRVARDDPGEIKVYLQNFGYSPPPQAIFDVDGFIYENPPTFIDVHEIDRIAVLTRNGAFMRYGPQGAGGVIIINTKEHTRIDDLGVESRYNNSGLRDSIYDEFNAPEVFESKIPVYIKKLNKASSLQASYKLLDIQIEENKKSPYFFLEVSNYFRKRWEDGKKADELLQQVVDKFPNDVPALKALSYVYEEHGQFDNALKINLRILKLRSRDAQSHRNVAYAYTQSGNFQKALSVYARYELAINELDTIPFDKHGTDILMTTESSNIIRTKGKELSIDKSILENEADVPRTRIVVEWSNANAEFELQFINPQQYYDDWMNTPHLDDTLLHNQKIKGYSSKQFFLDDDIQGKWQIKVRYLGNKTELPTYLKLATYFDYGLQTQTQYINVVKLEEVEVSRYLLSVDTATKTIFH
ncbi:carboxypeptidase-like regulatory domain-containing protein [uncultured Kriegella sp.]|uniref:carboxypeptidase-like regulatory domain-containing protein n=1 Tax=uncultured Kriegella sp. TaxID=1798910 RepID=UPI0030DAE0CB|tara:strand:+ start:164909 stop:166645 length:1737 start_codon:yes stop_codon:yes gene_type:complete